MTLSLNLVIPYVCMGCTFVEIYCEYFVVIMFRQILGGLEHLMNMGYYHGNFSLKGTYYQEQKRGEICVKLACFQKRSN